MGASPAEAAPLGLRLEKSCVCSVSGVPVRPCRAPSSQRDTPRLASLGHRRISALGTELPRLQ